MKTFYVKFVVITIGIMIFSSILAFMISNSYYQQKLKPENNEKVTLIAESVASYIEEHPNLNLHDHLENMATTGYQIYLVAASGEEHFYGSQFREKVLSARTKENVLNGDVYHGILNFPQETFVTGFFANELQNTVGVPVIHDGVKYGLFLRPDIKLLFNEMHLLFAWLLALTVILSIIFVALLTKHLVRPITKLKTATKSLAEGNYQVELDTNRSDELGDLSKSFLSMAKKIEQMDDVRKEFVTNISHDIQSPLSNIKGYTNLLENESLSQEEKNYNISIINDEIERLSDLTEQLLVLASLDRDDDLLVMRTFNVSEQLKELIRTYQWQVNEAGIMLGYSLPDVEMTGDPTYLYMVWDNLMSNALKYNTADGNIEIAVEEKDEEIHVIFENTSMALKAEEIERIFDRFYRVDTARTRSVAGSGLGLSIVWTIIKLHDGGIEVDNSEDDRTKFVVKLPKKI